jgi:hypothetical protein
MTSSRSFSPLPADRPGVWLSDHRRYYDKASFALAKLRTVAHEVIDRWPKGGERFMSVRDLPPEIHALCAERDMLADSVKLLSGISVEATLNYYGLLRFGTHFNQHFERFSPERKATALFLFADGIELDREHSILKAIRTIAQARNRLAHPKAEEVQPDISLDERAQAVEPEDSEQVFVACTAFFQSFADLVPTAKHFLPHKLPSG